MTWLGRCICTGDSHYNKVLACPKKKTLQREFRCIEIHEFLWRKVGPRQGIRYRVKFVITSFAITRVTCIDECAPMILYS
jgi:hypothetical protein